MKTKLNILNKVRNILMAFLAIALITSCEHDTDPPDGPNLIDRFGPFEVFEELTISRTNVDFSIGETVEFGAQFNKNVDWIITITGSESGAVKRITGFGGTIDATNASWDGGATVLPFFRVELCTVALTVPEEPEFINTGEVEIIGTKTYEGSIFSDFEEDAGADIFIGNFEFELTNMVGRQVAPVAAQGEFSWRMEGTDDVVANFFVGLAWMSPLMNGVTYAEVPTTVPENLYFNFFMHNDGRPHGIAVIQFAFDSNDSGAFEDGIDATFQLPGDFPLSFDGWKQFSHTMAEVGMTQQQLEKIVNISVILISDMNGQPVPPLEVGFSIDFMIFTQGAPLAL